MVQATDAVWLPVLPSMKGFGPALVKGAGSETDKAGKGIGERFGKGIMLGTAAIGAGALAAGAALYKVGEVFDEVGDTIRTQTGATGAELDSLVASAKTIGSTVPAEFEKIGPVLAAVNQRLGLSGETLEKVSSQYLEAGRILGEDVDVEKTSATFNAFGIEGDKVSGALDHLFQVSQATGVGMNELADTAAKQAPAMKILGFSFEETTALVGSFGKAGLNTPAIMASMGKGLVTLAKEGEKPQEAFKRTVSEIDNFIKKGDTAGALNLASKVFGTKGATQFIGALESGSLNMEDLGKVAGQTGDTILGVGEETADFAEQWLMFKNKVLVWLEPLATTVFGALGFAMGELTGGVTAFGAAWEANDGDITSSGIPGMMEQLAYWGRQAFDYVNGTAIPAIKDFGGLLSDTFGPSIERVGTFIRDTLVPNLQGFGGELGGKSFTAMQDVGSYLVTDLIPALGDLSTWLLDNWDQIANVATGIGVLLLPALARAGFAALISAGQQVLAWAMASGGAIAAGVTYVVQSFLIIGRWVAMAAAAVLSGATTAYIWGLYAIEAVKGALAHGVQAARVAAGWVVMSAAAVLSGLKTAAVWTVSVVAAAATGAFQFLISAGRVVGGWALMGVQSLIQAGRMALAWFIALGPIGWVIAAVIGLVAIVIANWDSIAKFTRDLWEKNVKPVFDALANFITKDVPAAFEKGVGFIKSAWEGLQEIAKKPVKFVIESIINDGLINGLNNIGGLLGLPKIGRVPLPPGFRKGGYTGNIGKDKVAGFVHGDEQVIRSESRRKFEARHPGALDHLNRHGELPSYLGAPGRGSEPFIQGPLQAAIRATRRLELMTLGSFPLSDALVAARAWNGLAGVTVGAQKYNHEAFGANALSIAHGMMPPNVLGYYQGQHIGMVHNNRMQRETMIHEVGHALGIHHNTGNRSIMHPGLAGGATSPTAYDAANLRTLYGPPGAGTVGDDSGNGGGGFNPLAGLLDGLVKRFKDLFSGAGFIADLAIGIGKKLFSDAANWVGEKLGFGKSEAAHQSAPYLHDQGGIINPGLSQVMNRTRKPEALLAPHQWADIHELATRNSGGGRGDIIFKGNVGWMPDEVADRIETKRRDTYSAFGI